MIKAVIVDDEKPSLDILKRLLTNSGQVEVRGCFDQAQAALEYIEKNSVDVVFIDIEMPGINGLELANYIGSDRQLNNRPAIVFVTAYNQYAVEAFRINALDYLVKPVHKDRLSETLARITRELHISIVPADIKVRCFGRFMIMAGDVEVKFRTKKAEELIAFLLDKQGRSVTRSIIIDSLWGDFDGDKALINFNTTLCYTRKALVQHGIDLPIIYASSSYRIDIQNIACDYYSFMTCDLSDGKPNQDNIAYYEEIVALYTGDYLEANDYPWAHASRLNLKEKYIRLLLYIADYYRDNHQHDRAIELMQSGFKMVPLNSKITHNLIKLLLEKGSYSLAADYYQSHREALRKTLQCEPDKSLRKLLSGYKAKS